MNVLLQSYVQCITTENNIKQNNFTSCFVNISKTISATSDSFLLIMSHRSGVSEIMHICKKARKTLLVFKSNRSYSKTPAFREQNWEITQRPIFFWETLSFLTQSPLFKKVVYLLSPLFGQWCSHPTTILFGLFLLTTAPWFVSMSLTHPYPFHIS